MELGDRPSRRLFILPLFTSARTLVCWEPPANILFVLVGDTYSIINLGKSEMFENTSTLFVLDEMSWKQVGKLKPTLWPLTSQDALCVTRPLGSLRICKKSTGTRNLLHLDPVPLFYMFATKPRNISPHVSTGTSCPYSKIHLFSAGWCRVLWSRV